MAELNIVDTGPGGVEGRILTPYLQDLVRGYSFGTGKGYLEFGSGTPGSLPFRVDQDGNVTANSVTGAVSGVDWLNVTAAQYGADPTGAQDSTAAIQAALNQIIANGGGVVYLPTGNYKILGGLTYASNVPLRITGDGPQSSNIRMANPGTSSTYLSITQTGSFGQQLGNDGTVIIENLSFYNDHFAGAAADVNIAVYLSGVNFGQITNVSFYKGTASQRVNQAIVCNLCNQVDIDNCNIFSLVNGITFTGECQVCNVQNTSIWEPAGTGVATAASILISGQTLGVNLANVIMHDGDRGLLWTEDAGTNIPHFFIGYGVQPNNMSICQMEFDYGAQVYLDHCVFSGGAVAANIPGLVFGSSFQGSAFVRGSVFSDNTGHSVQLLAGTGFIFQGCEFGGNGAYKFASNTYDEINIASGVGEVTINACHFNVDALAGLGSSNKPRSALNVASGVTQVTLTDCKGPGTGYGTATVIDNGAAGIVMKKGCIGLGAPDSITAPGLTVTSTVAEQPLSATLTVPVYDAVVGKVYRLRAWGHGTQQATTAAVLDFQAKWGGSSLGTWAATAGPAAAAAFAWTYELLVSFTSIGATAASVSNETFTWNGVTTNHNNTQTLNTQTGGTFYLQCYWPSASGAPTITCDGTVIDSFQNYPLS